MTYPIVKKPVKVIRTPTEYLAQEKWVQASPFDLALPYSYTRSRVTRIDGKGVNPLSIIRDPDYTVLNQCKSGAYARFNSRVSDTASFGEALFQFGDTAELLQRKLMLIRKTVRSIRRGNKPRFDAWRRGELKSKSRAAASLNLEMSFVVLPTMTDIYTLIDLLQKPIKPKRIWGEFKSSYQKTNGPQGPFSPVWYNNVELVVRYGADITVSNPYLSLATRLGLTNPAVTAWQLLPGSFLVDWFIPVEQFLSQLSDFWGLDVTRSYSTTFQKGRYTERWNTYGWNSDAEWILLHRSPGISLPGLAFRPLKTASWRRVANAASLAIQAFYK